MPRKSAAALSVVSAARPRPPEPPATMTPGAAAIWRELVATMKPAFFASSLHALERHCVMVLQAREIEAAIERVEDRLGDEHAKLIKLHTTVSRAILNSATKLHLTCSTNRDSRHRKLADPAGKVSWGFHDDDEAAAAH